jgi:hypothetical protein
MSLENPLKKNKAGNRRRHYNRCPATGKDACEQHRPRTTTFPGCGKAFMNNPLTGAAACVAQVGKSFAIPKT